MSQNTQSNGLSFNAFAGNANNNQSRENSGNGFTPAKMFVNIHLPLPNGTRPQVGTIYLHDTNRLGQQLLARILNEDGSLNAEALGQFVDRLEFVGNVNNSDKELDLGF